MEKVRYYKDELNDDFAGNDIKTKKLPEDHKYIKKNPFWEVASFILYYIVALPIVTVYNKIVHGERIKNKRILKKYRKNGYYIYGNHTMAAADAFTPGRVTFRKGEHNRQPGRRFDPRRFVAGGNARRNPDRNEPSRNERFHRGAEKLFRPRKGCDDLSRGSYLAVLHGDSPV